MLVAILGILLYAVIIQGGVLNPTIQRTQGEVREIACSQAESTANAFRYRQVAPNGKTETREHFLTRMLAQRHTLLIARDLGCKSAPGFPPFSLQVARALREINEILGFRSGPLPERKTAAGDAGGAASADGAPAPVAATMDRGESTSTAAPAKGGSDQPSAPGKGGSKSPSAPAAGGTNDEPSRADPGQSTDGGGSSASSDPPAPPSPKTNPIAEGAGSTVEGVGDVVQETGETANDGVEGVTGKACGLVGASC